MKRPEGEDKLLSEVKTLRRHTQYLAEKDGMLNLKILFWFVLVPTLLIGLLIGLMGIVNYLQRHAAH